MATEGRSVRPGGLSVDLYTGQVTALCVHGAYVLAGVGGSLELFDVSKSSRIDSQYVLPCHNIHGIKKESDSDMFCIWGENCFRVLTLFTDDCQLRLQVLSDAVPAEDWIWDVHWLRQADSCSLALALGHNVVRHWDVAAGTWLHTEDCVETCILYCAHLIGRQWSELTLAVGTVFNQVLLWPACGATTPDGRREVVLRLTGHDVIHGVIFGIDYHEQRHLVASVSDDRSVRVWQLTFPAECREPTASDWQRVTSSPIATLYGHSARVWDIRLLKDCFVSIGEDAACCVWNYQWEITHKLRAHKGKSIWSMAVGTDDKFVVTGGGDGSIRLWPLDTESQQNDLEASQILIPEMFAAGSDDHPRIVALLNFNTVLVMTMEGILYSYMISENICQQVFADEEFRAYSLLAVSPSTEAVALGSITGTLKILTQISTSHRNFINSYHEKIFPGKIYGLCWLDDCHLLITGPEGVMVLMKIDQSADLSLRLESVATLFLPLCKQRWVSAGRALWEDRVLVCGDRGGTVHAYSLQPHHLTALMPPVCSFPKIHGKSGVTDVCCQGNHVLTAGRDGHYRTWSVDSGVLQLLNSSKVMRGMDWIDRLQVTAGDVLVYGFHSDCFTVWSVKLSEKLIHVQCGGGHRSWDCVIRNSVARFVYLKAKDVVLFEKKLTSNQNILKPAVHGRELCDVKYIATVSQCTGVPVYLLACCSEDTTINIISISYRTHVPELRVHHTLQGHLSTVRCLCLSTPLPDTAHTRRAVSPLARGDIGPARGDVGPTRGDVGPARGDIGPARGDVGLARGDVGPASGDVAPARGDVGPARGDVGRWAHKIMFSAGGRAQIQVWRVRFVTKHDSRHSFSDDSNTAQVITHSNIAPFSSGREQTSVSFSECSQLEGGIRPLLSIKLEEEHGHNAVHVVEHNITSSEDVCSVSHIPDRSTALCGKSAGNMDEVCQTSDNRYNKTAEHASTALHANQTLDSAAGDREHSVKMSEGSRSQGNTESAEGIQRPDGGVPGRTITQHNTTLLQDPVSANIDYHVHHLDGTDMNQCDGSVLMYQSAHLENNDKKQGVGGTLMYQSSHLEDTSTLPDDADRCVYEHLANCFLGDQRCGKDYKSWKVAFPKADPETRILDLTAFPAGRSPHGLHCVAAACSDGLVRLFGFNESTRCLSLLQQSDFHGNCVLKVEHFPVWHDGQAGKMLLLSAATDGRVAMWDISSVCDGYTDQVNGQSEQEDSQSADGHVGCGRGDERNTPRDTRHPNRTVWISVDSACVDFVSEDFTPVHVLKGHHQSGVNSLHVRYLKDKQYLICSGGDDNCLSVSVITIGISDKQTVTVTTDEVCQKPSAHAAQITGTWIVSDDHIVTASIDQRVCVWEVTRANREPLQVDLIDVKYVHVSDISNIDVWQDRGKVKVAVCGEGLTVLTIDLAGNSDSSS